MNKISIINNEIYFKKDLIKGLESDILYLESLKTHLRDVTIEDKQIIVITRKNK